MAAMIGLGNFVLLAVRHGRGLTDLADPYHQDLRGLGIAGVARYGVKLVGRLIEGVAFGQHPFGTIVELDPVGAFQHIAEIMRRRVAMRHRAAAAGISSVVIVTSWPGNSAIACFIIWVALVAGNGCCATTTPRLNAPVSAAMPPTAKSDLVRMRPEQDIRHLPLAVYRAARTSSVPHTEQRAPAPPPAPARISRHSGKLNAIYSPE